MQPGVGLLGTPSWATFGKSSNLSESQGPHPLKWGVTTVQPHCLALRTERGARRKLSPSRASTGDGCVIQHLKRREKGRQGGGIP